MSNAEMKVGRGLNYRKMSSQFKMMLYGEIETNICPNVIQPFLENIDRWSRNNVSPKLILVFYDPHWLYSALLLLKCAKLKEFFVIFSPLTLVICSCAETEARLQKRVNNASECCFEAE